MIDLSRFTGIDAYADLRAQARQVASVTMIVLGAAAGGAADSDVLTLANFSRSRLDAADFLLA